MTHKTTVLKVEFMQSKHDKEKKQVKSISK